MAEKQLAEIDEKSKHVIDWKKEKSDNDKITILFLGLDQKTGDLMKSGRPGYYGLSDTIILLTLDTKNGKTYITSLPRDTVTDVSIYSTEKKYLGKAREQITLQYSYGSNVKSCVALSKNAISDVMVNVPIDRVIVVNYPFIQAAVDGIGGMDVTMSEDWQMAENDRYLNKYKKGETVHLEGKAASVFANGRSTLETGSAEVRVRRQRDFVKAYSTQLKKYITSDIWHSYGKATALYDKVKPYMYTDIDKKDAVYLALFLARCKLSDAEFYTVEGDISQNGEHEEYNIDHSKIYEYMRKIYL